MHTRLSVIYPSDSCKWKHNVSDYRRHANLSRNDAVCVSSLYLGRRTTNVCVCVGPSRARRLASLCCNNLWQMKGKCGGVERKGRSALSGKSAERDESLGLALPLRRQFINGPDDKAPFCIQTLMNTDFHWWHLFGLTADSPEHRRRRCMSPSPSSSSPPRVLFSLLSISPAGRARAG